MAYIPVYSLYTGSLGLPYDWGFLQLQLAFVDSLRFGKFALIFLVVDHRCPSLLTKSDWFAVFSGVRRSI